MKTSAPTLSRGDDGGCTGRSAEGYFASQGMGRVAAMVAARSSNPILSRGPLSPGARSVVATDLAALLEGMAEGLLSRGMDDEATDLLGAAGALRERVETPACSRKRAS
jgi:hypothetical protein